MHSRELAFVHLRNYPTYFDEVSFGRSTVSCRVKLILALLIIDHHILHDSEVQFYRFLQIQRLIVRTEARIAQRYSAVLRA
jgi:hypothetical protein